MSTAITSLVSPSLPQRLARSRRAAWYDGHVSRPSRDQRGFTLIELMIVVAVIAGLAAVAIPSWIADSRRGKYDPEISAMFSEISTKEEAYKSEIGNGSYLSAPLCPGAVSPVTGQNFNTICVNPAGNWNTLRVNASDTAIRCTYVVTVGA